MTTANKITCRPDPDDPGVRDPGDLLRREHPGKEAPRIGCVSLAITVFLLAALSDGLDGYVARRYNQRSSLGVILDPIADKGLLLSGIITLSISNWSQVDLHYGKFPAWFPVLVITRDAVILIGSAVLHILNGTVRVRPSWTGKSRDSVADGGR